MKKIKIGLFYNLRQDYPNISDQVSDFASDMNCDWDVADTINEIINGLQQIGFDVIDLGDPLLLLQERVCKSIDLVFSICEMQGYRFRESLVPSLCELIKIPYMFSTPDTLMISLDKNICNFVVSQNGINVPKWYNLKSSQSIEYGVLNHYPYIVKPSCEGSGMGINDNSVVYNESTLQAQVEYIINNYRQPALVQEFVPGREFTIGVMQNNEQTIPLKPLEIIEKKPSKDFTYNYSIKEIADSIVVFEPLENETILHNSICKIAVNAFNAIGCRDIARVDIRLSGTGEPCFLEINPLPHLHPIIGDFCRSAKAFGLVYDDLLLKIINNAMNRFSVF